LWLRAVDAVQLGRSPDRLAFSGKSIEPAELAVFGADAEPERDNASSIEAGARAASDGESKTV